MTDKRTIHGYTLNLAIATRLIHELGDELDYHTTEPLDAEDVLSAAAQLAEVAEELLHQAVTDYRAAGGRTWQQVASVLDISRQAAQQRFGA